jgi:hypothetical protein
MEALKMENMNQKKSFVLLLFTCILISSCFGAVPKQDPNNIFKIGDYRDIKILTPKQGFKGSPLTAAAYPSFNIKIPSTEEDFDIKYARITISQVKMLKNIIRVAFLIDEIDPNKNPVMYFKSTRVESKYHEPIYYAYLFIRPNSCRIIETSSDSFQKELNSDWIPERDVIQQPNKGLHQGIQFPLTFTFPPKLSPYKNMKDNSYITIGNGVVYHEPIRDEQNKNLRYTILYIETAENWLKDEKIVKKYFSKTEKTLSDGVQADSTEVTIRAKETQTWADDNDWLWKEMERTDADGNITMRCKRLK